jgi:hypothetical protein
MTGESPEAARRIMLFTRFQKKESSPPRNEAQLNCVSLRSEFDCEVTWGTVKGQDERPYGTPLTPPQVTPGVFMYLGKNKKDGRHVGP